MTRSSESNEHASKPIAWHIIEKVILPTALLVLAASQALVARQQVEVARLQLTRQTSEASSNLQLKYIELFYHDLQDPDPRKQRTSIALLSAMQPAVAQTVSRIVFADPGSSSELRQQVTNTLTTSRRFGPLVNYRLVIYFPDTALTEAAQLRSGFVNAGYSGTVELRQKDPGFLTDATKYGYHIRYDDAYEAEAADYLMTLLPQYLPGHTFKKVRIVGRPSNDGALTIFLFAP